VMKVASLYTLEVKPRKIFPIQGLMPSCSDPKPSKLWACVVCDQDAVASDRSPQIPLMGPHNDVRLVARQCPWKPRGRRREDACVIGRQDSTSVDEMSESKMADHASVSRRVVVHACVRMNLSQLLH
jgi:hypothetical protein